MTKFSLHKKPFRDGLGVKSWHFAYEGGTITIYHRPYACCDWPYMVRYERDGKHIATRYAMTKQAIRQQAKGLTKE